MRRYLSDQPENFGQFLGRTLSGTVAPYLENRRQQGILDARTAQEAALKQRDWQAGQDYRSATLAETGRHNLAMEAPKPEKASTPYHPATIEAAIIDVDRDPNLPPEKKAQIKSELIRLHQSLQKPEKQTIPESERPLSTQFQNTLYNTDVRGSRSGVLRDYAAETGQNPELGGEHGLILGARNNLLGAPEQLQHYNYLGGPEHRGAWFADDSGSVKFPNLAGRFTGGQGGFGPDGSFNSEEEWQQAKKDLGL